jgi:nitric oxide reductase NorE protein
MMSSSVDTGGPAEPHLPGEAGIWVFILGDLVIFSLLFSVFMYYRSEDPALYIESQKLLNQRYGLFNTLLMLTSSWFVALGIQSARRQLVTASARLIGLAFLCGAGFIAIKFFEYREKFQAGLTIETNDFFMYYFLMTGIHLLHVVIGMGVLLFLWHVVREADFSDEQVNVLESGASFWHLVDILWIVLFALLYLMR